MRSNLNLGAITGPVVERLSAGSKKNAYLNDPVLWAEEYLGIQLWSKQKEILYSIRDNRRTAVAAARGVGKSFCAAVAMAWWIDVHPIGVDETGAQLTFVASTAPFQDQITAILWNNVRILHLLSKKRYEEGRVDHPLPGYITGDNKWKTNDGITIGQGRKPPDSKADSGYSGLHAEYLLAIGDEAAGLNQDMVNNLGNITTGSKNRLLLIANPTDPTSAMASIWTKDLASWVRMHISVLDSPLITKEDGFDPKRAEGLSGQDLVDDYREEWGEDHAEYIINILGNWAFERGNNVFTDVDIARGVNCLVQPEETRFLQLGVDVARGDKDATELYLCETGEVWETDPETGKPTTSTGRKGWRIRYVNSWKNVPLSWSDPESPGTAQRVDAHARAVGAQAVAIDAAGLGRGVTDPVAELALDGAYVPVEIFGNARTSDRRAYANLRVEAIFDLQNEMRKGNVDIDGSDEGFLSQLRAVIFDYNDKGVKIIESKDKMKKRGLKSPDKVDAAWYSFVDVSEMINPSALQPGDREYHLPEEFADVSDLYTSAYGA